MTAEPLNLEYLNGFFWEKVHVADPDECWLWQQSTGSHGYGQTWDSITVRLAHRCAWELTYGRIPGDMTIDHLCRVRTCCNPQHLRLLSNVENARLNGNAVKTHCRHGHEYTAENTILRPYKDRLHRSCRTCVSARKKAS